MLAVRFMVGVVLSWRKVRADLEKYCMLDAEGMKRVVDKLKQAVN